MLSASLSLPVLVRDAVGQPVSVLPQVGEGELHPAGVAKADQPHTHPVRKVISATINIYEILIPDIDKFSFLISCNSPLRLKSKGRELNKIKPT